MNEEEHVGAASVPVAELHTNVSQVVIPITEDKLRLILRDYEAGVAARRSWMAPLGIVVTVLATLTTGEPNGALLPKDWWLPVYATAGLSALVWLSVALRRCFSGEARRLPDVDAVIQSIKNAR